MERWNNYTFISMCLFTNCLNIDEHPEYPLNHYMNPDHRSMPADPVNVQIDFHVTSADMNFDNRILYVEGAMKLVNSLRTEKKLFQLWFDKRKVGLSERGIGFDRSKMEASWNDILLATWLPSMVYAVNMMNEVKHKTKSEGLLIRPDGQMIYFNTVMFELHCGQWTNNFPFEKYVCGLNIRPQVRNSTVNYENLPRGWLEELRHRKFKVDYFYTEATKRKVMTYDTTYYYHQFSIGAIVTRHMSIILGTFLAPSIAVSLMDMVLYVFSKPLFQRFALLPAYFCYMRYLDKYKTDYDWPLIAIFLYSRFICTVVLLCWNIASATSLSTLAKGSCFHPNWQNNWKKRLLALIVITASIQLLLFGVRGDFFPSKKETRTYEEIIRDGD